MMIGIQHLKEIKEEYHINHIKEKLNKEFITCAILSYKIENANVKQNTKYIANCKYCPITNCQIKNNIANTNIFDIQALSCVQSILQYFNIDDNYKNYIQRLSNYDIIDLIKAYRMNYYQDDNCKFIDNNLLHCPIYDICKKYNFKYNCCFKDEDDNLTIWSVEHIKEEQKLLINTMLYQQNII